MECLEAQELKTLIKERSPEQDKRSFGKLGIIAGSPGMMGAAIFCGRAAMRSGVGLGTFFAHADGIPILQIALPECTCVVRDQLGLEKALPYRKCTAAVIGPGLGLPKEKTDFFSYMKGQGEPEFPRLGPIFETTRIPVLVDADGLNALRPQGLLESFANMDAPKIITPHEREAARLMNVDRIDDREAAALKLSKVLRTVTVLKGDHSLIATPEGELFENPTGNVGLATGGTGDVLAGLIGGFLAQGYEAEEAAKLGVYLHGLAGDLACEEKGQISMIASDVIEKIPEAFRALDARA